MKPYKKDFITFMVRSGVLTFGDFVTKSGRNTPFFINTGNYRTGEQMRRLGVFYAEAIHQNLGDDFDNLYGPAYKGIPLCVAAAMSLSEKFQINPTFTFNRKEVKDHGEGGGLIGQPYQGGEKVVIVEDVTTAGTSIRESAAILRAAAAKPPVMRAVVVSVDRMERGTGDDSALAEIAREFQTQTFAIVTLEEIMTFLHNREIDGRVVLDDGMVEKMQAYRAKYGPRK